MFELDNIELRRGGRRIARIGALRVASPGLLWLVGPGGAGKSTLLSALAGGDRSGEPSFSGDARLDGLPLAACRDTVAWLPQHDQLGGSLSLQAELGRRCGGAPEAVQLLLERAGLAGEAQREVDSLPVPLRRYAAVFAGLARPAGLYLVDEPTAGLDDVQAEIVRNCLRERAAAAMVVAVTHNRRDCLAVGGDTALLAGGTIRELAPTQRFFDAPSTEAGRIYVETGNCNLAPVQNPLLSVDGIWWLVPGLLCGMSRPGLVGDALAQYGQLADAGVGTLLCVEERCGYPIDALRELGIERHHFAVPDMAPPSFGQAVDMCRIGETAIRANRGVAVHCRGGLGRTGTVLACILIWFGDSPDTAIARVRSAQPHAIQTPVQLRFLHDFADRIRGWHDPQYQLGEKAHVS